MSQEDRAQEQELMQWELNNRSRPEPVRYSPGDAGYGPEDCDGCGAEMPTVRREHGFTICVGCKSAQESRAKLHRH